MRRLLSAALLTMLVLVSALAVTGAASAAGNAGWQPASVATGNLPVYFADITMLPGGVGLAVGEIEEGGPAPLIPTIFRTADGGATWTSNTDEQVYGQLSGVAFSDAQHAWAVGADYGSGDRQAALVLSSSDAGQTWSRVTFSADEAVQKVQFPTATTGYITGNNGTVYVSTDGGAHWAKKVPGATDVQFAGLSFTDATHGWVCGAQGNEDWYRGRCYATGDGGATWKDVSPDSEAIVLDCSFLTGGLGWVVSQEGVIFHTTDGGASWAQQSAAIGPAVELTSVDFVDAQNGWASGLCWPPRYAKKGWAVILHTTDGGQTWVQQDCDVAPAAAAVTALGAETAWVAGADYLVLRTSDGGGAGFTPQARPQTTALNAVAVRRKAQATFRFRITDVGVPRARAVIVITDARHRERMTIAAGFGANGETRARTARISLPAGRYSWKVVCCDYAGYTQASASTKPLVVK